MLSIWIVDGVWFWNGVQNWNDLPFCPKMESILSKTIQKPSKNVWILNGVWFPQFSVLAPTVAMPNHSETKPFQVLALKPLDFERR